MVVRTSVWRAGKTNKTSSGSTLLKTASLSNPVKEDKTPCHDFHWRQKGEKSSQIESIFCSLCVDFVGRSARKEARRAPSSFLAARREDTDDNDDNRWYFGCLPLSKKAVVHSFWKIQGAFLYNWFLPNFLML